MNKKEEEEGKYDDKRKAEIIRSEGKRIKEEEEDLKDEKIRQ